MTFKRTLLAAAITSATLATGTAHATNGYFSHGFGVKSSGMAGGGVAFANDSAMVIATNPAGITDVSNQVTGDITWFSPRRGYDFTTQYSATVMGPNGPMNVSDTINGSAESDKESFFLPAFGFTYALTDRDSVGLAVYGNGGMNTDFDATSDNYLGFGFVPNQPPGPYGAGKAGVNLEQMFISPTYARELIENKLSIGISPIITLQRFKANGLTNFNGTGPIPQMINGMIAGGQLPPGTPPFPSFSVDGENMTNNGTDTAWGYGGKLGVTFKPNDMITLGASYQTKIRTDEFDEYSGLFAESGDFDIPSTWTVGLAADVTEDITVTFDYQRINYGEVKSISNPSNEYLFMCMGGDTTKCLGGSDGAGFGWDDIDVFKLGVQWQAMPNLQLRAGWNRGDNPISSDDALFNTIAPGVMEDHFTAGFSYAFNKQHELHGSLMYAPEVEVDGKNPLLSGLAQQYLGASYDQDLTIRMKQYSATVGYTYKF